jgi:serine/threonine protein kinase
MARRTTSSPPVLPGFSYVRPLGSGGFADVFLYEQDMPRRVVAVKVLLADAINPDVLRAFTAEADVMARLSSHPSILTIYQASVSADGRPYLVMEYCTESLSDRYKRAPLSLAETLDVGVRMAAALETAHRSGVLHRDIKPSNVLITSMGTPVLADFGIAASLAASDEVDDVVAMSIPWSAPEVVDGSTTGTVSTEVWSLGATIYTLLAGRSPFASDQRDKNTREAMSARILKATYQSLGRTDVPGAAEDLLRVAMARSPAGRPATMLELAEQVRWLQHELGLPTSPLEVSGSVPQLASDIGDRPRGPLMTTVNHDSRRAARAAKAGIGRGDRDDDEFRGGPVMGRRARMLLLAAVLAAGVIAAVVVVLLILGVI